MYTLGLPIDRDSRALRTETVLLISLALHMACISVFLLYPLIFKEKPIKVSTVIVQTVEKPKVRLRKPKTVEKTEQKQPAPKKEAPAFSKKPENAVPEKKIPETVENKPDSVIVKEEVKETHEEMTPQMVMSELTDPRLSLWVRMVSKIMQSQWHPPGGIGILGQAEVNISFSVIRSGLIQNTGVNRSSGNKDLDGFALTTVERVGKLPPIPPHFREKDQLDIQIIFHYAGE